MVKFKIFLLVVLFLVLVNIHVGYSRSIRTNSSNLISDGIDRVHEPQFLSIDRLTATVTCEPIYGFLPCSGNILGYIFLIVLYQYLLYLGESYISAGSDLMFQELGTGIFGAGAFQVLGSLPEAILVFASGVYGTIESAQGQVMVGMGILSGSTILLLTLIWGSCVLFGKYDLPVDSTTSNVKDTKGFSLTGSGVTTDLETSYTARIMIFSTIPFIIAQLPHIFGRASGRSPASLSALIICLAYIFANTFYQVFQPWIQTRRLEYLLGKFVDTSALRKLLTYDGKPNTAVIADLFHKIDKNNDKFVTILELKGLILGIQFEEVGLENANFVEMVLKEYDTSGDGRIDEKEFVRGISKWLSDRPVSKRDRYLRRCSKSSSQSTGSEQEQLIDNGNKALPSTTTENSLKTYFRAAYLLLLGVVIVSIVAAPIVDSVLKLSNALNIPTFYISFIVVPFVVNYREGLSTIKAVRQKNPRTTSLTFSEIYTGAFMNNVVGLAIFSGIVYARSFVWDFSAEVLVVVVVTLVMGLYAGFCKTLTFPLWTSLVAILLYPLSLFLLYLLTNVLGWA